MSAASYSIEQNFPFTEYFRGRLFRGWKIIGVQSDSGAGSVNLVDRTMEVPLGSSSFDHNVRMHEFAHVFLSRGTPYQLALQYKACFTTYQAVEDARMHHWLTTIAGLDLSDGFMPTSQVNAAIANALEAKAYRDLTLMLVSGYRTGQEADIRRMLERSSRRKDSLALKSIRIADATLGFLTKVERPSQQRTGQAARFLERKLQELDPPRNQRSSKSQRRFWNPLGGPPLTSDEPTEPTCVGPSSIERIRRGIERILEEVGDDKLRPVFSELIGKHTPKAAKGGKEMHDAELVPWGKLLIEEPALTETSAHTRLRKRRSVKEGWHLRSVHRLLTDGRVFAEKVRHRGGAVLIDCSGSMGLSQAKVCDIIQKVPGAVVGAYAGNGNTGTLRILGRNGTVAHKCHCEPNFGHQNCVDLPALEWLAKQSQPLVWISDGRVTGCHDRTGPGNEIAVDALCKKAGIHRVLTVQKAVEWMQEAIRKRTR